MKLKKSWDHRAATIIEGLFLLEYGDDELAHEKKIGAPYVNNLLRLFINKFPVHSFMELEIEYMSKKHVVGGAIDLAVGVAGNGDKPRVKIQGVGSSMHLFFGCLGEAKGADVQLATTKDTGFVSDLADIKAIIQPALEVMTISEVATFPKSNVPLELTHTAAKEPVNVARLDFKVMAALHKTKEERDEERRQRLEEEAREEERRKKEEEKKLARKKKKKKKKQKKRNGRNSLH